MSRDDGLDELAIPGVPVPPGVRTTVFVGVGPNDRPFRPLGIEIAAVAAPRFHVLGFRVGAREQIADFGGPIPGEVFDEHLPNTTGMLLDVCRPGGCLELDVVNITDEPQTFACKFPGRWIDPSSLASSAAVRELLERRFPPKKGKN